MVTLTVPGSTLATFGAAGLMGGAMSGLGSKRVKPCCGLLLTVVKSPPTKSCRPSVAKASGPSGLPFVSGYQGPSRPSVGFCASRL
jgi:hypothetical protein